MPQPLDAYGLSAHWTELFNAAAGPMSTIGRVVRQDRGYVMVATEAGEVLAATRAGRNTPVVVGDWVIVEHEAVVKVLERQSLLSRQNALERGEQPIVANVDLVLIVCGADRPLNARRIERAVTQTSEANATPVIVVTKLDLLSDRSSLNELQEQVPTVEIIGVSSRTDSRLTEIYERMHHKTSVMIGESGAGKSTLLNALLGDEVVATGEVREKDSKGRHTTVRRELHLLPGGGALIDTPGVRALGLWAAEESVNATFPDIAELAAHCRFADCSHETEPGCAVTAAVEAGEIEADRVAAYNTLQDEVARAEVRQTEHERRASEKKFSKVVDQTLKRKGRR